jgi:hypothetical protein
VTLAQLVACYIIGACLPLSGHKALEGMALTGSLWVILHAIHKTKPDGPAKGSQ